MKSPKTDNTSTYKQEFYWVLYTFISTFYYLAIFSYDPKDPSYYTVIAPKSEIISNSTGKIGAEISAHMITWLGFGTYILPILFGVCSLGVIRSDKKIINSYLSIFIQITITSSVVSLILTKFGYNGGWLGEYTLLFFVDHFGDMGTELFLALIIYTIFTIKTKQKLISKLIYILQKLPLFKSSPKIWLGTTLLVNIKSFRKKQSLGKSSNNFGHSDYKPTKFELSNTDSPISMNSTFEKESWDGNTPLKIDYKIPSSSHFKTSSSEGVFAVNKSEMQRVGDHLTSILLEFGVVGKIIGYQPGPVVTVFEFQPEAGIKQAKITGLIDDIALALKVDSILIQPVKGKRALGVQVPNLKRQTVFFGDLVNSTNFQKALSPLTFAMGKALDGTPISTDLTEMPHLLVAGATGSGKSVGINSLICSVVMKASPAEVRMILVDPKMLELSVYEGIPHLLMPVITEPHKAALALRWAVNEMERRYKIMQTVQVRNIKAFNSFWKKQSDDEMQVIRDQLNDQEIDHMPFILLVIDELADLMLTTPKEVESIIQRLAQKARASGIHMVLATQRPSVDIITGVIKANLPSRIAFQVVSKHDSRTILDQMGADKLLGKGDMLFQRPGISKLNRIQGAFVGDQEVVDLVKEIKNEHSTAYNEDLIDWIDNEANKQETPSAPGVLMGLEDDPKWDDAITIAQRNGQISASFLQRQLKIGYNRAARIVESMESQDLIDKASGSKPRKWKGPQDTTQLSDALIRD